MLSEMYASVHDAPVLNVMLMYLRLGRYKDALVLLLREVLNRIQFRYNQAQLEELDDETLDDDVSAYDSVSFGSAHFIIFVHQLCPNPTKSLKLSLFCGVTIATNRVAEVPASESGGCCQGDGITSLPCVLYFGEFLMFLSARFCQTFTHNTEQQFVVSFKFPVLQENLDVYMGLQQFIVTTGTSKSSFLFSASVIHQHRITRVNFGEGNQCMRSSTPLRSEA